MLFCQQTINNHSTGVARGRGFQKKTTQRVCVSVKEEAAIELCKYQSAPSHESVRIFMNLIFVYTLRLTWIGRQEWWNGAR